MGTLERLVLSDRQWDRIAAHFIGDGRTRGSSGSDNRMFVEAVLWIVRTGSTWRDLPDVFGAWNSAFRRFSRWSRKGIWWQIFEAMAPNRQAAAPIPKCTGGRSMQNACRRHQCRASGFVLVRLAARRIGPARTRPRASRRRVCLTGGKGLNPCGRLRRSFRSAPRPGGTRPRRPSVCGTSRRRC